MVTSCSSSRVGHTEVDAAYVDYLSPPYTVEAYLSDQNSCSGARRSEEIATNRDGWVAAQES